VEEQILGRLSLQLASVGEVRMRRFVLALLVGCALSLLPIAILKLPSDSGMVGSLKWGVTNLMIPGSLIGYIAAGGRIDDISSWLAAFANMLFYFGLAYLLLTVWAKFKTRIRKELL
jgi:hypothetical protein